MIEPPKDHFIRYRIKSKPERMTLIIGFVCKEGIALVSDTKISNPSTLEPSWQSKILTPLSGTPFIVGAAGFTDLFIEFNRKIRELVEQRIREYKIINIEQLIRAGYTRDEAISIVQLKQKSISDTQQSLAETPQEQPEKITNHNVELPFIYTAENFLDDCKSLIRQISEKSGFFNPIELLIGIRTGLNIFPNLYYIDSKGREELVHEYKAIGSGEPYVKMFFKPLHNFEKSIPELAKDAMRAITFASDVARENSVGYSDGKLPEVVIVDGTSYGRVEYQNMRTIIAEIKQEMSKYTDIIANSKIPELKEE